MKKILLPVYFCMLPALSYSYAAHAEALTGCAAKRAEIENQIAYAKAHNNHHQVAGLEAALNETRLHCTEAGLLRERQQKVAEKERKVAEREAELTNAIETGSAKKITRKKKKVAEAQEELQEAKDALER
ncbi:DUF1090 domain-containing protein [Shimwellia blattae]|uniref:Protein YqjC n=1 Tax=Shimwellia blattae (strain ATCC 29907 / DSM 4481 / JCM 1650 / NBRC 105725 / CDC 9005-74) TaxID=630626 RepID=I2BD86_SHIBC|nr:DUF1090 domain-containing protein [Shimwellia blattae]AFJ48490.1 hypothetical protein EBL_c34300 [Shimwellia blattae DSM 4481 = NBRC 105725]GAB82565.1 hypothetical protein YqjC [Shimwellia blattae DSM 4481 = NBRC 105725]VDY65984.1 Protein of uncharacterised function (DUF1090) [Shimwellia blattae]VEC26532.1 Protein of uncharacterised function (DUF1090) [Shimwellia blattae]